MNKRMIAFMAVLALVLAVAPAHAVLIVFADYSDQVGFPETITTTGTTSTISGSNILVSFEFKNLIGSPANPNLANNNHVNATMNFSLSTSASGTDNGTTLDENGWFGTINIFWTPAQQVTYCGGPCPSNLLTMTDVIGGSNTGAALSGNSGGTSFTGSASTPPLTEVVFTSSYINFGVIVKESYGVSFASSGPVSLSSGATGFLGPNGNTTSTVGNFSVDPTPTFSPEPATMAMLGSALIGLGLLGKKHLVRK